MSSSGPAFSVVVPTRDRPVRLDACLAALAGLAAPPGGYEVIVVDDGGSAPLEPRLAALATPFDLTLAAQPHRGPAAARNLGARRARGRWLAFTDDDCAPEPGWLVALAAAFAARPAAAVGGAVVNGLPDDPCAAAAQAIVDAGYAYLNAVRPRFFAANNLALPADRFAAIGGFDPTFRTWEDRELCERWAARGWELVHAPEAVVRHRPRLGLVGFCRQQYGYGKGARRFTRARRAAGRRARPDPRFYRALWEHAVRDASPAAALERVALVALAQAAAGAGFLRGSVAPHDTPVSSR